MSEAETILKTVNSPAKLFSDTRYVGQTTTKSEEVSNSSQYNSFRKLTLDLCIVSLPNTQLIGYANIWTFAIVMKNIQTIDIFQTS